jgi:hypothetical protein
MIGLTREAIFFNEMRASFSRGSFCRWEYSKTSASCSGLLAIATRLYGCFPKEVYAEKETWSVLIQRRTVTRYCRQDYCLKFSGTPALMKERIYNQNEEARLKR